MYIRIFLLIIFSMISGCATWQGMTDAEKASIIVGVVATTAIISSRSNGDTFISEVCQIRGNKDCGE